MTAPAFVRQCYKSARAWGIQPSEFWAMSPQEWYFELEGKLDEAQRIDEATAKTTGKPTKKQMKAARERLKRKQEAQNNGRTERA